MDKIIDYIKKTIDEKIISVQCVSRLLHKNIVFKVTTDKNEYAIKIYYNGNDKEFRFENEVKFYKFFSENKIINTPLIVKIQTSLFGNIMVMKWVSGISLKKKIKEENFASIENIYQMLNDLEKIWEIQNLVLKRSLVIDEMGLSKRINIEENQIFLKIAELKQNINFSEIIDIYAYLKNTIKPRIDYVINSDVSMHEYLITDNKNYWIDFERFRLGDPNNDLARSFQSLTNGIYKNNVLYKKIFEIFVSNKYYDKEIFLYYLTEKLLTSIYVASNQISDDEIEFYIKFIKENFYKKNKQPLR